MKVSVVIPAFNVGRFLDQAVESVFTTHYPDLEVLIVDDGSRDNTLAVADSLRRKWQGDVKVLGHAGGRNRGAGASRNVGIKAARGNVISFLDADYWYFPNRFLSCIAMMNMDRKLDAVYSKSRVYRFDETTREFNEEVEMALPDDDTARPLFERLLTATSCWTTNSITYRTRFLRDKVGLFNEHLRLGQDLELSLRASLVGKFEKDECEEPVAAYRRHPGNRYEGGFSFSWHRTCVQVYGNTRRWMKANHISQEYIDYLDNWVSKSSFGRSDIWISKGQNWVARRLLVLLGLQYPIMLSKRKYWGNLIKSMGVQ